MPDQFIEGFAAAGVGCMAGLGLSFLQLKSVRAKSNVAELNVLNIPLKEIVIDLLILKV